MKTSIRLLFGSLVCVLSLCALPARSAEEKPDPGPAPSAEETKAVAELNKRGVRADPLATGVNWRYVNFRSADKPDPALYALLKAIPSIVELDLAGMQFGPGDLGNLSGLTNLTSLNLARTNVADADLAAVKGLEKLEALNLFSTGITDEGLKHLAGLKKLRRLYVFETKVTDAGVDTLAKALTTVRIDRGWDKNPAPVPPPVAKAEEKKPDAPAPAKPEEKKPDAPKPEEKKAAAPAPKPEEKKADAPAPKPEEKKPDAAPPAKPEEKKEEPKPAAPPAPPADKPAK